MIKAILIDDEVHCTKILNWEINNHCPDIEVVAICHSAQLGMAAIAEHTPDIVFLDIEMPRINGFEMLERLDNINFEVIFTTAYDQFAIRAIRISALGYLLKPINHIELNAAIDRYKNRKLLGQDDLRMSLLFEQIRQPLNPPKRIAISTQDSIELEFISDIIYFKADGNYTTIYMTNGRKLIVSKTLKHFEDTLEGQYFLRVHHSYYVNLDHISKYIKSDGGYLLMSDKSTITVSRRRRDALIEKLNAI